MSRRKTSPESPLLAAWGSPPAVLRCGVSIDAAYKTGDQVFEVEAEGKRASWFFVKRGDHVVYSTPLATVHVELIAPPQYQGSGLLARLTPAVSSVRVL